MTVMPGLSRLFLDFCAGAEPALSLHSAIASEGAWQQRPPLPPHQAELVGLLAQQNPSPAAAAALNSLAHGAGTVVTGQQVGLFGGPLFTPFKAATAIARARQATASGNPHVPIFWLATEDHDFAEINHVAFPARRELRTLSYDSAPASACPVGPIVLDDSITALVEQAAELLGPSDALTALEQNYRPGRTLAHAFAGFYSAMFAAQGLLMLDAGSRAFHALGAPVLRAGIERADELHAALLARNTELEAAGYHAQVAVTADSSLLFLIDEQSGARVALRRTPSSAAEPNGLWHAGPKLYSTADLVGILAAEPERISPSALLRPVFQDFLLGASLIIGGPAEIAYFAQSSVLYERILGRQTPAQPRMFATIVEPATAELLDRHELPLERVLSEDATSLSQLLAARAMPVETKQKLAAAGNALDTELTNLVAWMQSQDQGLGQSADTAAGKIRYQMGRLRTLAANFQLQKEASLGKHAQAIATAVHPDGTLQERVHGAAYYFARHGIELAEILSKHAENTCPGHTALWL
jgi:bacillithiol biosynthesis cysteine-adding enzyme BshC